MNKFLILLGNLFLTIVVALLFIEMLLTIQSKKNVGEFSHLLEANILVCFNSFVFRLIK